MRDMKVKTKLLSGFAAMAVLVLATSVLALLSLSESNNRFRAYLAGISHRTQLAAEVRSAANARAIAARNLVLVTSDADRRAENVLVTAAHKAVQDNLSVLRQAVRTQAEVGERERQLLTDIDKVEDLYGPVALHIVGLALAGKRDDAVAEMNEKCRPLLAALLSATHAFVDADTALAQAQAEQSDRAYSRDIAVMSCAATLAAASALLLGWLLSGAITGPLKKAAAAAEAVASGDLCVDIEVDRYDETGQLLDALKRMTAKLSGMVSAVRDCADGIQLASSEIAAGNLDLSTRTEHQASALQQTASSMAQMTSTVCQNAEASNQANDLAVAASAIAGSCER